MEPSAFTFRTALSLPSCETKTLTTLKSVKAITVTGKPLTVPRAHISCVGALHSQVRFSIDSLKLRCFQRSCKKAYYDEFMAFNNGLSIGT